jgi:salicylate hydroxylase
MVMKKLGCFVNESLRMTSFGDAANGMPPHMGASMSAGFIGVTNFLHKEWNPRLGNLAVDASKVEIAKMLAEASIEYEKQHRPLSQKLLDYSIGQGKVFMGQVLDVEEMQKRPKFLWRAATKQDVSLWE